MDRWVYFDKIRHPLGGTRELDVQYTLDLNACMAALPDDYNIAITTVDGIAGCTLFGEKNFSAEKMPTINRAFIHALVQCYEHERENDDRSKEDT